MPGQRQQQEAGGVNSALAPPAAAASIKNRGAARCSCLFGDNPVGDRRRRCQHPRQLGRHHHSTDQGVAAPAAPPLALLPPLLLQPPVGLLNRPLGR